MPYKPVWTSITDHMPSICLNTYHTEEEAVLNQGPCSEGVTERDKNESYHAEP